jgi:hypothetical protein
MYANDEQRLAEMGAALSTIKQEIDALQIASKHYLKPWYRDGTVFVSAMALIFSLGTTAVSYVKGVEQLRQEERRELRDLSLKLGTIPRELFEFQQKYSNNQQALSGFSGLLNTEQQILSKQASEIISRIPDLVSASEHLYVANALMNSNLPHLAQWHIEAAIEKAKDADEIVGAYRIAGNLAFLRGDPVTGRQQYELAKTVLNSGRVPIMNATYVAWSNSLTDIRWAQTEAFSANCAEFEKRVKSAIEWVASLPDVVAALPRAEINYAVAQGCPPHVAAQPPTTASVPAPPPPPRPVEAGVGKLR